jgi:hypothetical protein
MPPDISGARQTHPAFQAELFSNALYSLGDAPFQEGSSEGFSRMQDLLQDINEYYPVGLRTISLLREGGCRSYLVSDGTRTYFSQACFACFF